MNISFDYYARNEEEKKFDDAMRLACVQQGTKADIALCAQQQTIISMLRRLEDEIAELKQK